jgi:hypothetical protein
MEVGDDLIRTGWKALAEADVERRPAPGLQEGAAILRMGRRRGACLAAGLSEFFPNAALPWWP